MLNHDVEPVLQLDAQEIAESGRPGSGFCCLPGLDEAIVAVRDAKTPKEGDLPVVLEQPDGALRFLRTIPRRMALLIA